jgi:hypothetical protein
MCVAALAAAAAHRRPYAALLAGRAGTLAPTRDGMPPLPMTGAYPVNQGVPANRSTGTLIVKYGAPMSRAGRMP